MSQNGEMTLQLITWLFLNHSNFGDVFDVACFASPVSYIPQPDLRNTKIDICATKAINN